MISTRIVFSRHLFQPLTSLNRSATLPEAIRKNFIQFQRNFEPNSMSTYKTSILDKIKYQPKSSDLLRIMLSTPSLENDLERSFISYPFQKNYTEMDFERISNRAIAENNAETIQNLAQYQPTKVKYLSPPCKVTTLAWKTILKLNAPKLDIEDTRFSEYSYEALLEAIIDSKELSSLSFSKFYVDQHPQDDWVYKLVKALQIKSAMDQSTKLKELSLDNCDLEYLAAQEIANGILEGSLSELESLNLHGNMIDNIGADSIYRAAVREDSDIKYINFSANYLDKIGVSLLKQLEENNQSKVKLNLSGNDVKWAT